MVVSGEEMPLVESEVRFHQKLSGSPNIVRFVDWCRRPMGGDMQAEEVYLLMEHCDSGVLDVMNQSLKSGLSETYILDCFSSVCRAVVAMHMQNPPIIHRDLKVENVLVGCDGQFKLCDFGSSTTIVMDPGAPDADRASMEEEIQKRTTLQYRSPEMVDLYLNKKIDTKLDIWALGCLLYKLCYFTTPFGDSIMQIAGAQYSIPSHPQYSPAIRSLLGFMLVADPTARPDIAAVCDKVYALRGLPSPLHKPSAPQTQGHRRTASAVEPPTSNPIERTPPNQRPTSHGRAAGSFWASNDQGHTHSASSSATGTLLDDLLSGPEPTSAPKPVSGSNPFLADTTMAHTASCGNPFLDDVTTDVSSLSVGDPHMVGRSASSGYNLSIPNPSLSGGPLQRNHSWSATAAAPFHNDNTLTPYQPTFSSGASRSVGPSTPVTLSPVPGVTNPRVMSPLAPITSATPSHHYSSLHPATSHLSVPNPGLPVSSLPNQHTPQTLTPSNMTNMGAVGGNNTNVAATSGDGKYSAFEQVRALDNQQTLMKQQQAAMLQQQAIMRQQYAMQQQYMNQGYNMGANMNANMNPNMNMNMNMGANMNMNMGANVNMNMNANMGGNMGQGGVPLAYGNSVSMPYLSQPGQMGGMGGGSPMSQHPPNQRSNMW
eukprot:comp22405_c0_seq1/m.33487 comp22405_c0_seq1/g.33487  ORF comp22405_c0_seq1/g.33487 comp22405_c0_seq1/m.33487 type:complete len:655 (-) comp22405_c0_seq1:232-2196(-)